MTCQTISHEASGYQTAGNFSDHLTLPTESRTVLTISQQLISLFSRRLYIIERLSIPQPTT